MTIPFNKLPWVGNEGTESQSFCNSTKKAAGSKSGLMDMAWPNLIKHGPKRQLGHLVRIFFQTPPTYLFSCNPDIPLTKYFFTVWKEKILQHQSIISKWQVVHSCAFV